jgi:hypothetical protein
MLDLTDPVSARRAARETLRIAADPEGYINRLGPHAGLLLRLLDWAGSGSLRDEIRRQIRKQVRKYPYAAESLPWKLANAVAELKGGNDSFSPVPGSGLALERYHSFLATGDPAAAPLKVYLDRFENVHPPESPVKLTSRQVVFLITPDMPLEGEHSVVTACLEAGAALVWAGSQVLLVGRSERLSGYWDGIPFLGLPAGYDPGRALAALQPIDTLIAVGYPGLPAGGKARHIFAFDVQQAVNESFGELVLEAVRCAGQAAPTSLALRLTLMWGRVERIVEDELPERLRRFRLRVEDAIRRRVNTVRHGERTDER